MAERKKIERYAWVVVYMIFLAVVIVMGYFFLQELEAGALERGLPATAAEYRNLKIPIVVFGLGMEAILGYWGIWRRTRVERTKHELVKLVALGKMTEEQAAKKLGVTLGVIRDAVKELKKEGVVE